MAIVIFAFAIFLVDMNLLHYNKTILMSLQQCFRVAFFVDLFEKYEYYIPLSNYQTVNRVMLSTAMLS